MSLHTALGSDEASFLRFDHWLPLRVLQGEARVAWVSSGRQPVSLEDWRFVTERSSSGGLRLHRALGG